MTVCALLLFPLTMRLIITFLVCRQKRTADAQVNLSKVFRTFRIFGALFSYRQLNSEIESDAIDDTTRCDVPNAMRHAY